MHIFDSWPRRPLGVMLILGTLLGIGSLSAARDEQPSTAKEACADDNGGLTLPPGFCATVFADNIGHARHLVVPVERPTVSQSSPPGNEERETEGSIRPGG